MKSTTPLRCLLHCGWMAVLLLIGCADEPKQADDLLVEQSESPLVQSVRTDPHTGITVKYLPPQFLAAAETEGASGHTLDSLADLYSQSLSFLVSIKQGADVGSQPTSAVPDALLPDDLKGDFWIEAGDTVYAPDVAQLEHHGGNQRRYYLVFGVDPRRILAANDTLAFAVASPQGRTHGGIYRFRFAARDILQSSDAITQLMP